ncbi:EAL domain-containing protein [Neokomagataea thailandica]|uniref:Diguanylate cyclase n=1 Tax=Neokomagataea tanensis NBRC 106556 TaxID=1223519 RepID=A0ABQ0QJ95_9PROT|nr:MULTISPECIES: EAL domain-containing protein [Neokomagataea]GBR46695.1 diguanylate cyclase [Neokomagataea tanensis NBRC 106556]
MESGPPTATAPSPIETKYAQIVLHALGHTAGIIIIDLHGKILYRNEKILNILHTQGDKYENCDIIEKIKKISQNKIPWNGDIFYKTHDGIHLWTNITITPYFDKKKNITYYIATCFDVTAQKSTEDHLRAGKNMLQKALTIDPLTGLPNRLAFSNHIKSISQNKDDPPLICIYMIDIDAFKIANDTLGHKAGDKLLKKISKQLRLLEDNNTFVARMAGDEFSLITTGSSEEYFVQQSAHILKSLNFLFSFNGILHHTTASIGYAITNKRNSDIYNTLYLSDIALYHSKSVGGNCAHAYNSELKKKHDERNILRNTILKNLNDKFFHIKYNPIIDISSNTITGITTVLLLRHNYIPEIKKEINDLHDMIGDITVERALYQISINNILNNTQKINGIHFTTIAVPNINIAQTQIISGIFDKLKEYPLNPQNIALQIDNSFITHSKKSIIQRDLASLRQIGVKIILSGFGKESTYLMSLRNIEYDYAKIDSSLIKDLSSSTINQTITKSLIDIAHSMGKHVIAEGVETAQCADILTQLGCDFAQGSFYSPPLSLQELEKKLQTSTTPFR